MAEKIDRISRLPLAEAEQPVASIRAKRAKLAVPGLVDLSDFASGTEGVARIVLDSIQGLLRKRALQMAHDDYEIHRERQRQGVELAKAGGKYADRSPHTASHKRIVALRTAGHTIHGTASLTTCSPSKVKRIRAIHLATASPTEGKSTSLQSCGSVELATD